jgi:hypothetical protein
MLDSVILYVPGKAALTMQVARCVDRNISFDFRMDNGAYYLRVYSVTQGFVQRLLQSGCEVAEAVTIQHIWKDAK